MAILITIIGFGIMVCLHELGHFITAKKFGVLVHEFSIGMGPKIVSFGKGETKYSLRLLPIGGYVRLEGEGESSPDDNPRSFANIKPIKRIIILFAGAFMNLLLGWLIFIFININMGVIPSVIDKIPTEYSNVQTVLKPGDTILKLNKTRVHTFDDVALFMSRADGKQIEVTLRRGNETKKLEVKPLSTDYGYKLGVTFKTDKAGFFKAAHYGVYDTIYIAKAVIMAVGDLITGKAALNTLSGPVEIVSVVGEVTKNKNPYTYISILMLFAMITVNLGVFNLLPFPALDGGSIVFALYELITHRKVKPEVLGYINTAGFALLMLLAIFVTFGDVRDLLK